MESWSNILGGTVHSVWMEGPWLFKKRQNLKLSCVVREMIEIFRCPIQVLSDHNETVKFTTSVEARGNPVIYYY